MGTRAASFSNSSSGESFLLHLYGTPLLTVNVNVTVTDIDFVKNKADYESLVKAIISAPSKRGGNFYLSI